MGLSATVSRPGQLDAAGDVNANFLKIFSGEILTAFNNSCSTKGKVYERTITSGKSASFPVTGTATAKYHTPGTSISDGSNGYLNQIRHGEKIISIDDLLIAPVFIASIDELKNHYDVRSIYSTEIGTALALQWDKNVLRKIVQAARVTTAAYTGGPVGTRLALGATAATTASVLAAGLWKAAQKLDEKNVPKVGRYCFLPPAQYYLLAGDTNQTNSLWGGNGSYSQGRIVNIAGIDIFCTNQLPNSNESTQATGDNNDYHGDYSATVGVVFHQSAVGTVKLLDLATESEYQLDKQGHLFVAKYAVGHGILRPEASVELSSAAS